MFLSSSGRCVVVDDGNVPASGLNQPFSVSNTHTNTDSHSSYVMAMRIIAIDFRMHVCVGLVAKFMLRFLVQ